MAAIAPLKLLTVNPISRHTATVIFVHGLGDTGYGWKPVADMFRTDEALQHVKWVFPHSPTRAVTANMGMEMPSWFDILSFGFNTTEDEKGMLETVHSLNKLITAEVDAGIQPSRILLGGFSQGGAMTILTGLSTEFKLSGLVVLSGWLPLRQKLKSMTSSHFKTVPIFWGHGTIDPLIKYQWGTDSINFLQKELGVPPAPASPSPTSKPEGLEFRTYEGVGHSTNQEELEDLRVWIKRALPKEQ